MRSRSRSLFHNARKRYSRISYATENQGKKNIIIKSRQNTYLQLRLRLRLHLYFYLFMETRRELLKINK